jgi:signal transduction histidine kinase
VAEQFRREQPHASISVDLPATLHVATTDRIRVAVESLVENAIEHNPVAEPRVWIETRTVEDGAWADLTVSDDGPEIPEVERAVVTGDTEITSLSHGTGLGLWLVRWTVDRFGGELSFERTDVGNCVRVRLPLAEPASPDAD